MKRRCSKPTTKAPSWIPTSSQPDINRGKRVRFSDVNVDIPSNFQAPQKSVEVKTSEFAFFKKFKEDAGQKFTSRSTRNESNQTDNFKSMNASRENKNFVNNSCKEKTRSSLLIENATPVQFVSFHSPLGIAGTRKDSDVCMKTACSTLDDMQWKQKDMEEYSRTLRPEGTHYRHVEVFNRKREKLQRWVTDVSFPEIDGLFSKGCDIVPVLLSRLIPESKDNNNVKDQKLGQVEIDAKSQLVASSESDNYCKRLQWTPRHFTELECGPYLGDAIAYHPWNRSRGRILFLDAPLCHDKAYHHNKVWDSGLQEGIQPLCTDNYSSFVFPFRRLGSVELLEELDECCQKPNGYFIENQSNIPMLGWNNDNEKAERNLSITSQDIESNTYPMSLAPRVCDDKFYADGLFSSPNVLNNEEPECSRPLSRLSSYDYHERGIHFLEGKEDILPNSNHLPLTLSHRTNYISSDKDFYNDTGFPHQDHWSMSKPISQWHPYPETEALLSSRLVLELGWKCHSKSGFSEENHSSSHDALEYARNQSISSRYNEHGYESCLDDSSHKSTLAHFTEESEDNVGIHDWSSFSYQESMDSDKAFSLILNGKI